MATTDTFEHVRCDLCGHDDTDQVRVLHDVMLGVSDDAFRLVRCRACGLMYLNPRPTPDTLDRYYPDDYAPFAQRGISARVKRRRFRLEVNELWRYLSPPARVIDIGCATGELLQAIRERGNPNVLGIEPSATVAEEARSRWKLDVVEGTLQAAALPDTSIDAALMSHAIEHLPSPSETLSEIRRVLRPNGALILWLPNADSLAAQVFGEAWMGYDAPRHLYDFTPETLSLMLQKHGFEVRSINHEWIGLEWSWGIRLLARKHIGAARVERLLALLHPANTAALTPVSTAAALIRRGGRIRIVATRPFD